MMWAKRFAKTEWRLLRKITRIAGHSVNPEWLWIVQWILGVIGIFWALGIGTFIVFGGAQQMTGELYQPLLEAFDDYRRVGAVIILGGLMGVVGLVRDIRWLSVGSSLVCACWNGILAVFTIIGNWVPNGSNLLCFFAAHVTIVYLMRFVLLTADPGDDAVNLREREY